MSRFLNQGDVIEHCGQRLAVSLIVPSEQGFLASRVDGKTASTSQFIKFDAFAAGIPKDTSRIVTERKIPGSVSGRPTSDEEIAISQGKREIVRRVRLERSKGLTVAKAVEELGKVPIVLKDGKSEDGRVIAMPSLRTVYRLLRSSGLGGNLIPNLKGRGNRDARHSDDARKLVVGCAKELFYVTESRFTLTKLTTEINDRLAEGCELKDIPEHFSRKAVRNILVEDVGPDLDLRRMDPRTIKAVKAVAANRIRPGAPFARVEIDTLHVPVVCRSGDWQLTDVRVMFAICCATSVVLGWKILVGAPTEQTTLACIESILNSKREHFKRLGIVCLIDPVGCPLFVILDNGPENLGQRLLRLSVLGMEVHRCPPNSPQLKPFVERLNRSLKTALETLPGFTRFEGKDGMRKHPEFERDKLMTLEELERWIVRFFYEKWIHHPLDRFITADYELRPERGITPFERWNQYAKEQPFPLPPSAQAWAMASFLPYTKSLSAKTGITYDTFQFKGHELRKLISEFGPQAHVQVLVNPDDYRYILALSKDGKTWLKLINAEVDPNTPAISFEVAKGKRNELLARKGAPHPISAKFDRDLREASCSDMGKKRTKRTQQRLKTTSEHREDAAARRAEHDPLPQPRPDVPQPDMHVTADGVRKLRTSSTSRSAL